MSEQKFVPKNAEAAAFLKRVTTAYDANRSSGIETIVDGNIDDVVDKIPAGALVQAEIEKGLVEGLNASTKQFRIKGKHDSKPRAMTVKGKAGFVTAFHAETMDGRYAFVRLFGESEDSFKQGSIVSLDAVELPAGTHTVTVNSQTGNARVVKWKNGGFIAINPFGYESSEQELTLVAKVLTSSFSKSAVAGKEKD